MITPKEYLEISARQKKSVDSSESTKNFYSFDGVALRRFIVPEDRFAICSICMTYDDLLY